MALLIRTTLGNIKLKLLPDAAPETVRYIQGLAASKLFDGTSFYRSDFVIQCGLHGSGKTNPHGDLAVNETHSHKQVSNSRGTASIAHWDVPDCGNSEFFINLQENAHLDQAYGGYCVFAKHNPVLLSSACASSLAGLNNSELAVFKPASRCASAVQVEDAESFSVVDSIAAAVKQGGRSTGDVTVLIHLRRGLNICFSSPVTAAHSQGASESCCPANERLSSAITRGSFRTSGAECSSNTVCQVTNPSIVGCPLICPSVFGAAAGKVPITAIECVS